MTWYPAAAFYSVMTVAALWWALLVLGPRVGLRGGRRWVNLGCGLATVMVIFLPMDGLRLWHLAFTLCPNPSLPLLGIVCVGLAEKLFGRVVFRRADWSAIWIFGALAGTGLYLHPLWFGSLDLYFWGWERDWAIAALATLAVIFFLQGNRFGVLLLAALIGYAVNALESANGWDYVIDPFYWLLGLIVVTTRAIVSLVPSRRRTPVPVTGDAVLIFNQALAPTPAGVAAAEKRP